MYHTHEKSLSHAFQQILSLGQYISSGYIAKSLFVFNKSESGVKYAYYLQITAFGTFFLANQVHVAWLQVLVQYS
jgi:hypothetical protein